MPRRRRRPAAKMRPMSTVSETPLPGLGVRFEFVTKSGARLGVLQRQGGRTDLLVYDPSDPDTAVETISLSEEEARTLAELLGYPGGRRPRPAPQASKGSRSTGSRSTTGLRSSADDRRHGARTRTGVSIVAVLRRGSADPGAGPRIRAHRRRHAGVVGTPRGSRTRRDPAVGLSSGRFGVPAGARWDRPAARRACAVAPGGFSRVPLFLIAGLAFGKGGLLPLMTAANSCRPAPRSG